jgi:hypothetical protein
MTAGKFWTLEQREHEDVLLTEHDGSRIKSSKFSGLLERCFSVGSEHIVLLDVF